MLLLAACQAAIPASPAASQPVVTEPPAASQPVVTDPPPAAAGEAYVVTIHREENGPFFDVRVDAVAPAGGSRTIASFVDVHPAGWEAASPYYDMRSIVSPGGLLPVVAEQNGGMEEVRTLLLDLRLRGGPPVEIAGPLGTTFWGPDGRLAMDDGSGLQLIDPRSGARQAISRPEDVSNSPAWLADGSGWPASRSREEESTAGWLSLEGKFTPGSAGPIFEVTGLERFRGANGGGLGMASSDGATQSETAITERRSDLPGPCNCIVWARNVQPGDDPAFGDAVWDANGTGIWIAFSKGDRRWLSHLVEQEVDRPVADLPASQDWRIAGISADDRWVVVASEAGSLVLVDTATGAAREIARVQGAFSPAPMFAGWVR
jgi:hypothetical protein